MIASVQPRSRIGLGLVLLTLGWSSLASSQSTDATIEGGVVDATGGVLPGVAVVATNEQTGLNRLAVTGARGTYAIVGLPPGPYTVKAELGGFATEQRIGQVLALGSITTLDFTLQLASLHDAVT